MQSLHITDRLCRKKCRHESTKLPCWAEHPTEVLSSVASAAAPADPAEHPGARIDAVQKHL